MADVTWDQSKFDALLREQLMRHTSDTWPNFLNKKMFFVALGAYRNTPVVTRADIDTELMRQIPAKRQDKTVGLVSVGYAMAAKRAAKTYLESTHFQRQTRREMAKAMGGRGKGPNYREAWLKHIREVYRSMFGGRVASTGFLRAGFVSIVYQLAPHIGKSRPGVGTAGTKIRGAIKGTILHLAKPGDYSVTIENRAHARSERHGGFERIGGQALREAFDTEAASMIEHLKQEMQPAADHFNRQA